ncbi:hypothetical protein D3C72_1634470 [compost metagenome]
MDLRAAHLAAPDAAGLLGADPVRPGRSLRFRIRAAGGALRRAGRVLAAHLAPRSREYAGLVCRHVLFADGRHGLARVGGPALPLARPDFPQYRPPDHRLRTRHLVGGVCPGGDLHPGVDRPGGVATAGAPASAMARHRAIGQRADRHLDPAGAAVAARGGLCPQLSRRVGPIGPGARAARAPGRMRAGPGPGQRPARVVPDLQ